MIGWGHIFRSQVSAIGTQVRIIRLWVRVREIDPLSSVIDPTIDSVIAPLQVAGGSPG